MSQTYLMEIEPLNRLKPVIRKLSKAKKRSLTLSTLFISILFFPPPVPS